MLLDADVIQESTRCHLMNLIGNQNFMKKGVAGECLFDTVRVRFRTGQGGNIVNH
jgi:hypothetical protein